ncbi:hypothetical protein ACOME3_003168 [Neoechinorhynchus agilis]
MDESKSRMVKLLGAMMASYGEQRKMILATIKGILFTSNPDLMGVFFNDVLAFHSDHDFKTRRFVVLFAKDAAIVNNDLLPNTIELYSFMVSDKCTTVVDAICSAFSELYSISISWSNEQYKTNPKSILKMWNHLNELQDFFVLEYKDGKYRPAVLGLLVNILFVHTLSDEEIVKEAVLNVWLSIMS